MRLPFVGGEVVPRQSDPGGTPRSTGQAWHVLWVRLAAAMASSRRRRLAHLFTPGHRITLDHLSRRYRQCHHLILQGAKGRGRQKILLEQEPVAVKIRLVLFA